MAEIRDSKVRTRLHLVERSLKLKCRPLTMPIVPGCAKLCLVAFHWGHTPYGSSKVPCRFLSLGFLCRSLISGLTGALMTGADRVIRFQTARGLWSGAHGSELGDEYNTSYDTVQRMSGNIDASFCMGMQMLFTKQFMWLSVLPLNTTSLNVHAYS